jgi:hypothetical protein
MIAYGSCEQQWFIAMQKLGMSLESLLMKTGKTLSVKTVL